MERASVSRGFEAPTAHAGRTRSATATAAATAPSADPLRTALRPRGPVQFGLLEAQQPGGMVLRVEGEIDVLTAPRLTARLERIMRRHRGDVVLDLTNTEFIDSAGLSVLLSARRRLDLASRRMSVVCEGSVRRVIEQARLIETLGVAPESSAPRAERNRGGEAATADT